MYIYIRGQIQLVIFIICSRFILLQFWVDFAMRMSLARSLMCSPYLCRISRPDSPKYISGLFNQLFLWARLLHSIFFTICKCFSQHCSIYWLLSMGEVSSIACLLRSSCNMRLRKKLWLLGRSFGHSWTLYHEIYSWFWIILILWKYIYIQLIFNFIIIQLHLVSKLRSIFVN